VNYIASFMGLMTATPADASPDEMHAGDLKTAMLFGQRIVDVVRLYNGA
jgi:NAD(P)H dehydrogenase (quinone)